MALNSNQKKAVFGVVVGGAIIAAIALFSKKVAATGCTADSECALANGYYDVEPWVGMKSTMWSPDLLNTCVELEYQEQEYRTYYCDSTDHTCKYYVVGDSRWVLTGISRPLPNGTVCMNGLCQEGVCEPWPCPECPTYGELCPIGQVFWNGTCVTPYYRKIGDFNGDGYVMGDDMAIQKNCVFNGICPPDLLVIPVCTSDEGCKVGETCQGGFCK